MKSEEIYTRLVSCGWLAQRVASNRTRTGGGRGGGVSYSLISLPSSSHSVLDTSFPSL